MPEHWIDEHTGSELVPRTGFEHDLDATLRAAWRGEMVAVAHTTRAEPRVTWTRVVAWTAASVIVIVGVVALGSRPTDPAVTPPDAATTAPPVSSTTPEVDTTAPITVAPTAPQSTVPPPPPPAVAATADEHTVVDYLTALGEGRYDDAAKLLGEGGLSLDGRADLRPLFGADGTMPSLAAALQAWCEAGAMCQAPTGLTSIAGRVAARFTVGEAEQWSLFVGGTFEGSPSVTGLPPQLPPAGVDLAEVVVCPVTAVARTTPADLNGDGWYETVVLQTNPDNASFEALLSVCGTTLAVAPVDLPVDPALVVLALDVEDDGTDELLVASFADRMEGSLFHVAGGALVTTGQTAVQSADGSSFGCVDVDSDGVRDFVAVDFRYIGGSNLSNSTLLEYSLTVELAGGTAGASTVGSFTLPAEVEEAFRIIGGFCGPLQVQTG